ncbi:MAG: Peptidase M42 family protein [Caldanaerobacter subterraneus]|jgi:endoglucanase|uniref:M42 family metallopeptidase n=1 Tax=unclassified Thermoanaerobacter TaxID=2636821 RepID=UPI0000E1D91A|nr:M42 family metallopeptidase [Thermoanaerobacter sp. X514]KUJ90942.1 MAG: peptidase M42 family protein [Thermoanaerobacter thermocopriae]KUK35300.1 MAG: Peptidase M42 family protein [Caldanaerobacter subterraneus]MBE3591749.1 M42 family metallopeptidase [Thermoanaerobacter sp.]ABY91688.1 peptidase M42 family protein [Thermoanaerobacter sp. X514]HAA64659.1 M42 family peptidase [Thermoanaerobacter sp.]
MDYKDLLKKLSESYGVSGHERGIYDLLKKEFEPISDEVKEDNFGNLIFKKKGTKGKYKVMLAAHLDEIGLMVKDIDEKGFIKFTTVGGVDQRTLPSQEVIVHGKKDLLGVIGSKPPHLLSSEDMEKAIKIDDMYVDVGLPKKEVEELVKIGDIITIKRDFRELLNDYVSGKALDDRAGIVVMAVCLDELKKLYHYHDVYAVVTLQEEVGVRGATTSAYNVEPDIAIAIDVTHGKARGVSLEIELGKGPAIGKGPNIHPAVYKGLVEAAKNYNINYQVEPLPGPSGTDAWAIQVSREGVPTGLVSIPLRYMHTSVETANMKDVISSGKLLAYYIANLPEELEGHLCY